MNVTSIHRQLRTGQVLRRTIAFLGALLALTVLQVSTPIASASPELAPSTGWVRFGHFAPGASEVDVFVDGAPFASAIAFRTVSDYMPLPAGAHVFEIRAAGSPTSPALLTLEAGVPDRGSVTVGAVSTRDGLAPQVYTDQLVQPTPDASLVRFIHAAPDVKAVDVTVVGGPTLASEVPYPAATEYREVPPGTYEVEVRRAGTDDVVLRVTEWSIAPGVQSSIVIVRGSDGEIDVAPVQDAVAVAAAPTGGIQTGGGAMADVIDPTGSATSTFSARSSSFPSRGASIIAASAVAALAIAFAAAAAGRRTT